MAGEKRDHPAPAIGPAAATSLNQDVVLATYRGFVGQTYGNKPSKQFHAVATHLATAMLAAAPTFEQAQS